MNEYDRASEHRLRPVDLVLLFLFALLPRISGLITFTNLDENWGASVRILTGELSGGTSQTLPLINYLHAASFVILYAIGRLVGVWHTTADFRAQYFVDRTPFVFTGRFVAASLGAFSAPLAAMIASRLGLTRRSSLIVGVMAAILPINVWLSHFAKPDAGVTTAGLFLVCAILSKLGKPEAKGADVMIGLAVAIMVSFKQTSVFLAAPALVGVVALLRWENKLPWSQIIRGLFVSVLTCAIAWVPMNIGILVDVREFLDYQRATVIVMSREGTVYQIAQRVIPFLAGNITGLTAAGMVAWLCAPLVRRDPKFLMIWVSVGIAYVAFCAVSGGMKTQPRYFLPYDEAASVLGCVAAFSLVERAGRSRLIGAFVIVAILAAEAAGTIEVVRQAMATPMSVRCSEVVRTIAQPGRDKILAADPYDVGLPIDPAAADEDHRRHERLAKKYGVKLPERAKDKVTRRYQPAGGYYIRPMPGIFGGMEDLDLKKAETAIKPFWWPAQEEEWNLDYWTAQGFNIFVVENGAKMADSPIPLLRSFHRQITEQCEQVAALTGGRELFAQSDITVYRLRDHGSPEHPAR